VRCLGRGRTAPLAFKRRLNVSESKALVVADDTAPNWMNNAIAMGAGAEQIERLAAAYREHERFQAERAYTAAMTACQSEMKPILKNRQNTQTNSTYANLEAVNQAIIPVYTKHGFSLSFGSAAAQVPGNINIECEVRHEAGHCTKHFLELPPDGAGIKGTTNKTGVHAVGSTVSYARRYLTLLVFNIATTDDNDGNGQTAEAIDPDQIMEINDLIAECREKKFTVDFERFIKWLGVASLEELDQLGYRKAVKALKEKLGGK
jgi:hypothetical protein